MGVIRKSNENFSNDGFGMAAVDVKFSPGLSGLTSNNVNDAILEIAEIVKNTALQFVGKSYVCYDNNAKMQFLKDSLVDASRAEGGFKLFTLTISDAVAYIGMTTTAGTKCSFTLHSIATPATAYYGYFDNMSTGAADSFKMYQINGDGTELFTKAGFSI